jgi:hypothetical protein
MSNLKLCQGTKCHTYTTKDRIRGSKGNKHYETRRRSSFYYGNNNFCSLNCQNDWFATNGERAIDHFGRLREPKRLDCDNAWYKDMIYLAYRDLPNEYYFKNDLLGQRISISREQYQDQNLTTPNSIS